MYAIRSYYVFALERLDMFSEPYLFKFDPIWKKERPTLLSYFKTHPENGYTAEQSATNSFFTKWLNGDYFNLRYGMDDVFLNSSENYWNGFLLRDDINERFYENYGENLALLRNPAPMRKRTITVNDKMQKRNNFV